MLHGRYQVICTHDGVIQWEDSIENMIVIEGKNICLNVLLESNGYVVTGPYCGLINAFGYTAISATDIMSNHPGWVEYTGYTGARRTMSFSAAVNGTKTSSAMTYNMNTSGTVKGCFVTLGPGAAPGIGSSTGTLYSAGNFSADKIVNNGDTLSISWSASI